MKPWLAIVLLVCACVGGCDQTPEYDNNYSREVIFDGGFPRISMPSRISVIEGDGEDGFLSLGELARKKLIVNTSDPAQIKAVVASLRKKNNEPQAIDAGLKTYHLLCYEGTKVGYVKIKVFSWNGKVFGIVKPLQDADSVITNSEFLEWLRVNGHP